MFLSIGFSFAQSNIKRSEQLLMEGSYRLALDLSSKQLEDVTISKLDKGKLYIDRGRAYQYLMIYDSAFSSFHAAIDLFESANYNYGLAETYVWLMEYYRSVSNIFQVKKMELLALKYLDRLPANNLLHALYFNRKGACLNQFYTDSSAVVYDLICKAFDLVKHDSTYYSYYIRGNGWLDLGMYYAQKGDRICFDYYRKSEELWRNFGNTHYAIFSIFSSANAYYWMGDYSIALKKAKSVYNVAKLHGYLEIQTSVMYLQYLVYDALGDYKKALNSLKSYLETDFFSLPQNLYHMMLAGEKEYDTEFAKKAEELSIAKLSLMKEVAQNAQEERNVWATLAVISVSLCIAGLFVYHRIRKDKLELQRTVEYNEILLKEVNHRVKNNLTFLKSMLYLKEKYVKDDYSREILQDFQNRILAMSAVHTEMYSLNNVTGKVALKDVLIRNLSEYNFLLASDERSVFFDITGELDDMDLKDCLSLMLVLNELIVNSIKYVERKELVIKIYFQQTVKATEIRYSDNGSGFMQINQQECAGFGMRMIQIMLKQINAVMSFKEDYLLILKSKS